MTVTSDRTLSPLNAPEDLSRGAATLPPTRRRTVVLDTSVLLSDPRAMFSFGPDDVVVTGTVLGELGKKKTDVDLGPTARAALRLLRDALLTAVSGKRAAGVAPNCALPGGGKLRLVPNGVQTQELEAHGFDRHQSDVRIIGSCIGLASAGEDVLLVTNDVEMRLVASTVGIATEEYIVALPVEHAGSGWRTVTTNDTALIDELYRTTELDADLISVLLDLHEEPLLPNEGLLLKAASTKQSVMLRERGGKLVKVGDRNIYLDDNHKRWFKPRNVEQKMALDLLLDADVPVVALVGPAGTGKTILAMAAGLHMLTSPDFHYTHMGVYRPTVSVGRDSDLGHLPGTLEEKLAIWQQPVADAMGALLGDDGDQAAAEAWLTRLTDERKFSAGSIGHVRGRSVRNTLILVDEAQQLEPAVGKALVTRAGEGTKIVFLGDVSQQDRHSNPYLSSTNNALSALIEAFHGQPLFGHVTLTRGERSPLAELAARLL